MPTVEQLKAKGTAGFKKGDFQVAIESYQLAIDKIDVKTKTTPSILFIKKKLLSNITAAYCKLEMYDAAIESCQEALSINHAAPTSDADLVEKSQAVTYKLHLRLALAFEGLGTLPALRLALRSLIHSVPVQHKFKRTIFHNESVGHCPREQRQGKALPSSSKIIFQRLYTKIYGPEGTFSVNATPNLFTNYEKPWAENSGWCRIAPDSDELLYWGGSLNRADEEDWVAKTKNHPLLIRVKRGDVHGFTPAEGKQIKELLGGRAVDPALLCFFNTATCLWRIEHCSGTPAPRRFGHQLVVLNKTVYMWGGSSRLSSFEDPNVWSLDVTTKIWTCVPLRYGKAPFSGKFVSLQSLSLSW